MRLRPIAHADLEIVRTLRNRNRAFFFDDREITAEQQEAWFARLPERPVDFYVIEVDDRVVGTISVTRRGDALEIGNLILDDEYRGRGIMRAAVARLTAEPGDYVAEVKPGNDPSLNVFRAAGFSEAVMLRKRVERSGS